MIGAYKEGKDLYAVIASQIHHNDYWDNMEKTKTGEANPEGKKRRSATKALMLGEHVRYAQTKQCEPLMWV